METSRRSLAIIISRQDYREHDSLATFYTLEYGQCVLIARGTKRPGSKLAGHLEPISLVDLMIVPGKGRDYAAGLAAQETFPHLKKDLNSLYFAGRALSRFKRLLSDEEPDSDIFWLLLDYLNTLEEMSVGGLERFQGELFMTAFSFKFLAAIGYSPQIDHCLSCRSKIQPTSNYFNLNSGGLVCPICYSKAKEGGEERMSAEFMTISSDSVKLLRWFLENKLVLSRKLKISKKLIKELSILAEKFLDFRL